MSLDIELIDDKCPHCSQSTGKGEVLFESNITHNLGAIATEAHLYPFLWRAPEFGITTAAQLIKPLDYAIQQMESRRDVFLPLEPTNGWGTLAGFIHFCKELRDAAVEHPEASVVTDR